MTDWTPRPLGRTGLRVTPLCFGGGPIAGMPEAFGEDTPADEALATLRAILSSPVTFLDTAAAYGDGEGERRTGRALAEAGGPPSGLVLATKVDRDPRTGDFSGDQVRRSLERSLSLLGVDRVPLVHLHDPELVGYEAAMAAGGPVEALMALRDEGLVDHLGVAGGPVDLMRRFLDTGVFEVLLTHNRLTLLDRSADDLVTVAHDRGIGVLNAAVFAGGILVRGPHDVPRYAYQAASPGVLAAAGRIAALCETFEVPLGAVALQFSLRDPRITSSIVGVRRPVEVEEAVAFAGTAVPDELWARLEGAAAPPEEWLDPPRPRVTP